MRISDWSSDVCSSDLNLGVKDDLEQQVAKLVADRRGIAAGDRVRDLIGFLDRIGRDRREILRQIPFAAAVGIAQLSHDREQTVAGGRSEEQTSELQSLMGISYAVFCLKKQKYK